MDEIIKSQELTKQIPEQEFDYQSLINALNSYKDPERKRQDLLKKKVILRIKKGLYIWHPDYATGLYSKEILANLIYGPSYISLEYALSYWRLIPERVETVTSITPKKNKKFQTPVAKFTYNHININAYSVGVMQIEVKSERFALMATPEKALLDYIAAHISPNVLQSKAACTQLLFEDLRIDDARWSKINTASLLKFGGHYRSTTIKSFCHHVKKGLLNA
jgi:hypothetical protein